MSFATSTEDSPQHPSRQSAGGEDPGLRPWQFFLLVGMLSATAVVLVSAGQSPASIVILSLTVVAASFVALGAYRALAPLVVPGAAEAPTLIVGQTRTALEREKTLVLRAIKDLEFDYAMKKVAKSDFDEMTGRLRARAIGLMRQLDTRGGYREIIERELAAKLGPAPVTPAAPMTPAAAMTPASPASACSCGTLNDPDARFCKNCGNKLAA